MASPVAIELRAARERDFETITAIYAHHVRTGTATFEIEPPDAAEMQRRWREITARSLPYLVAIADAQIVGYAYAGPYRPRPAYRFTVEDSIYVDAAEIGRGIGRALLSSLVERCCELGYRQMVAVIGGSDQWPSIRLHEALGFTRAGLLSAVGFKFGEWVDCVLMQRSIGSGSNMTAPAFNEPNTGGRLG